MVKTGVVEGSVGRVSHEETMEAMQRMTSRKATGPLKVIWN